MGCALSRKFQGINRTGERKLPKLQEHVNDFLDLLPALRRWLAIDLLSCLSEARILLGNAQATVDSCVVNQKYQEKKKTTPNSKRRIISWSCITDGMRKRKGERVDAERSVCVTTGMTDDFRQLTLHDPFRCLRMETLNTLMENLEQLNDELPKQKEEINERLRSIEQSRKTWTLMLTAVSIAVELCFLVLLLAIGAPPVAVKAGTTAGMVIKTALELWIGSIWERRKGPLKEGKKAVKIMQAQLQVSLYDDLQSIESLVRKVKSGYNALAGDMEFLAKPQHDEEEALCDRLKDVSTKFNGGELIAAILSLETTVDECIKKIRQAEEALRFINIKP